MRELFEFLGERVIRKDSFSGTVGSRRRRGTLCVPQEQPAMQYVLGLEIKSELEARVEVAGNSTNLEGSQSSFENTLYGVCPVLWLVTNSRFIEW